MPHPLSYLHRPSARRLAAVAVVCLFTAAATGQDASPRGAVETAQIPTIPATVSRPDSWPTAKGKAGDNHVLSSIRANPGSPLEPVGELIASEVAKAVAQGESGDGSQGGVVQATFEAEAGKPTPLQPGFQSLEAAQVVARVGPEVVLEADLLTPKALEWLEKVTPGMPPEKVRELRLQICQQILPSHVETLLVYVDACREIPADKLPDIRKNVDRAFDEQQLPKMMKESNSYSRIKASWLE